MKIANLISNLLKEIDNSTEYKIQILMIKNSSKINTIKYLTGTLAGIIAIFILFIVSFDISKLYKYIVKKSHKIHKPKCVNPSQKVACNNFYKTIEIDKRYLEFLKNNIDL